MVVEPCTICTTLATCMATQVGQSLPLDAKEILCRRVSFMVRYRDNVKGIKADGAKLRGKIKHVERLVEEAEYNRMEIKEEVELWLKEAKGISEEFETKLEGKLDILLERNNNCFCESSFKIGMMLHDITGLLKRAEDFGDEVSYSVTVFPGTAMYYSTHNKSVWSREIILKQILEALKDNSSKVITIYGVPGAGKTFLLEKLVKEADDCKLFQVITEVIAISEKPDIKKIQESIAKRIKKNLSVETGGGTWSDRLQDELLLRLSKEKRILVVLDDVCTDIRDICEEVGIPFFNAEKRDQPCCTILMVSRKFDVPDEKIYGFNHFRWGCLNVREARKLFLERMNYKNDTSRDYITENAVLQKSDGLPITITELAHVLKERWPNQADFVHQLRNCNLSDVAGVDKRSYLSIKRSYDLLEIDSRKKFFLLSSCLFPPGRSIVIEDVIRYGIGLSLFPEHSQNDPTKQAGLWLKEIQTLSLFEGEDDQGRIRINNIIKEVAISIASEETFMLLLDNIAPWKDTIEFEKYSIISISAVSNAESDQELLYTSHDIGELNCLQRLPELPELKALFLKGKSSNCKSDFFAPRMEKLKVLGLTKMKLSTVPSFIEHLKHLVTLSVEYCDIEDASFISILRSLTILSFRGSKIKNFPGDGELDCLSLLDLTECHFKEVIGDVFANPSHMERLYMCGSSAIDKSEVVTESLVRRLRSLVHLLALEIEIPRIFVLSVGDSLLGKSLQRFKIAVGCKFPSPFKEYYLFNKVLMFEEVDVGMLNRKPIRNLLEKTESLRLVKIGKLDKVVFTLVSHLVHLKCLYVRECTEIVCIFAAVGSPAERLPELEILHLDRLDKLDYICHRETPQKCCSKLRELKLLQLKELKHPVMPIDDACKLSEVEISDCASLQHIFSTTHSTAIGEIHHLSCLKKLKLKGMPMLEGLLARDGTKVQLFHEKINLPALQELYLSSLGNIQKLCELSAGDPATAASVLGQLESLEITSCDNLEEVFKTETNANNATKFPSLRSLKLENLSSLLCFIQGSYTVEFPLLKTLVLSFLPMMSIFIKSLENSGSSTNAGAQGGTSSVTNQTPFIKEIKFPSLEHLEICDMGHIEKLVEDGHDAFPRLKSLTIEKICFELIPDIIWGILERLEVRGCGSVIQPPPWTSLQNLNSLVICGGHGMTSMFSSTDIVQGKGMPLLEEINIEECEDLGTIVTEECENAAPLRDGASMFPQLKHIKLRNLKNFITFTSGDYETIFEALQKVEVHNCPRFERFSLGELLITPELEYVKVDDKDSTQRGINLNAFIEDAFKHGDEEPVMEQHGSPDEGDPRPSQSVSGDDEYSQSWASDEESDEYLESPPGQVNTTEGSSERNQNTEPAMGQQVNEGDNEPTIAAAEDEATTDIVRMPIVIDRKGKGKVDDIEDKVDVISDALKTEEPLNPTARNTCEQIQLMNRNENTENPKPSGSVPGQVTNTERVEEHDYDPTEMYTDERIQLMNYVNGLIENNKSLFIYGDWVLVRDDLITFEKGGHLSVNIINVWAILLNKKHKNIDSPHRLIATATCPVGKGVQKDSFIHETSIQSFAAQLDLLIKESDYTTIDEIDMVLFPILASAHFYILSFSRKKKNLIEIIDNSNAGDDDIDGKYRHVCENLRRLFSQYLTHKDQDWAMEIENACHTVVKMDWRGEKNKNDCGIYAMRHLETYMGQVANEWNCGFNKGESNENVILSLRAKYNHAIIKSDLNEIHVDLTEVTQSVDNQLCRRSIQEEEAMEIMV